MKTLFSMLIAAGLIAGGSYYWFAKAGGTKTATFRTAPVVRDELVVVISATGTVEPEEVVDVGAQVAGRIIEFGKEADAAATIDYRSEVGPGTILARIDDVLYREEVNVAKAQLAKAVARHQQTEAQLSEKQVGVERAEADLKQMQARLTQAKGDWDRAQKLVATISQAEFDTYRAAFETAEAAVGVGNAAVSQAKSAVKTAQAVVAEGAADKDAAQAALNRAERNLEYTTIRSPIAGVIIDRRVNIGQTVVASLNAPSLFLIAKDLKRIQVWASVNEADIGQVHKGQKVRFTVDSARGVTFDGTVSQIRLNATMAQNVVTYTVVVNADNADEKLLPYLTANLQFEVVRKPNALLVPNAALRWKPRPEQISPAHREAAAEGGVEKPVTPAGNAVADQGTVWVPDGAFVRPIKVRVGPSDDKRTEIIAGDLDAGATVVTGEQVPDDSASIVNPLAPQGYR